MAIVKIGAGHLFVAVEVVQISCSSVVLVYVKITESLADRVKKLFSVGEDSIGLCLLGCEKS